MKLPTAHNWNSKTRFSYTDRIPNSSDEENDTRNLVFFQFEEVADGKVFFDIVFLDSETLNKVEGRVVLQKIGNLLKIDPDFLNQYNISNDIMFLKKFREMILNKNVISNFSEPAIADFKTGYVLYKELSEKDRVLWDQLLSEQTGIALRQPFLKMLYFSAITSIGIGYV